MPADFLMQQMAWREALEEAHLRGRARTAWPPRSCSDGRRSCCRPRGARRPQRLRGSRPPGRKPSCSSSAAEEIRPAFRRWDNDDPVTHASENSLHGLAANLEPGMTPDPHQRRISRWVSIWARPTRWWPPCAMACPSACRTIRGACCCLRPCATWETGAARSVTTLCRRRRPTRRTRLCRGQALHGAYAVGRDRARQAAVSVHRCTGDAADRDARGAQVAGRSLGRRSSRALRYRAEETFDDDIFGAVIAVPAYFDSLAERTG